MLELFTEFHWPTFFVSLVIFIVISNLWNLVRLYIFKKKAEARVKEVDQTLKGLFDKLKVEDEKIEDLIKKFEPPSK